MPLLVSKLHDPLLKLFTEGSKDMHKTAKTMADAYVNYTSTAIFPPGVPIFTGAEHALMEATILAVLPPFLMNPAGLGTAWAAGVNAFWLAPPIACPPGIVTACPGAASLLGALTAICVIPGQPAEVAATAMAVAIHAATTTTIATFPGPPPFTVPIA